MASKSLDQSKRRSERQRDKAVEQSSERDLESNLPSTRRTSIPSGRASRSVQRIININYNFSGDGMIIKGHALVGQGREEPSRSQPRPARPTSRVSRLKGKPRERISVDDDSESADESSIYSNRSRESSISRLSSHISSQPTAALLDHTALDEGYGTSSIQGSRTKKGMERMEYDTPSVPVRRTRKAKFVCSDSENEESSISGDETHLAEKGVDEEDSDDDDDDFAKRTIIVTGANNEGFEVKAILDTGTGPDWISQQYLTDVLNLKTCKEKNKKYSEKEFSDFQGKTFKPSGVVELTIFCDEFKGAARPHWFLVSRLSTFKILLGKKTIKKEGLLARRPRETLGDAAHIGLQPKLSKKEETEVARRRSDQDKQAAEQEKKREEKRKAKLKEKQEGRTRPANFAQEAKPITKRKSRSKSPSNSKISSKPKPQGRIVEERKSSESLEGTW